MSICVIIAIIAKKCLPRKSCDGEAKNTLKTPYNRAKIEMLSIIKENSEYVFRISEFFINERYNISSLMLNFRHNYPK